MLPLRLCKSNKTYFCIYYINDDDDANDFEKKKDYID